MAYYTKPHSCHILILHCFIHVRSIESLFPIYSRIFRDIPAPPCIFRGLKSSCTERKVALPQHQNWTTLMHKNLRGCTYQVLHLMDLTYANVQKSRCLYLSSFAFIQQQIGVRHCSTWNYRTSKCLGYTVNRRWSTESSNSDIGLSGGSLKANRDL